MANSRDRRNKEDAAHRELNWHLAPPASILAREIGTSNPGECPYVLFLGAGASVDSGIPTGSQLVERFKREIFCNLHGFKYDDSKETFQDNVEKQYKNWVAEDKSGESNKPSFDSWFQEEFKEYLHEFLLKNKSLYSKLFSHIRKEQESRQSYIEDITSSEKITASIGYFYLSCLLESRIIGCVLTTNFDDLIADTLFRYHDLRPIVCAFEASISNFNNSSNRPKIIKLHGDYLFSDIRNTESELSHLEENMRRKMIELCDYNGLVVVGYNGADKTIMDPILQQLQMNPDTFLTKGLHWCIVKSKSAEARFNYNETQEEEIENSTQGEESILESKEVWLSRKHDIPPLLWELRSQFPDKVHIYNINSFDHFLTEIFSHTGMSTKECFKQSYEKTPSNMYFNSVLKYKTATKLHEQMAIDLDIAYPFTFPEQNKIDESTTKAHICWELGAVQRDISGKYNEAIKNFEESAKQAVKAEDLLNKEIKKLTSLKNGVGNKKGTDRDLLVKYISVLTRKIGANLGIVKCHAKLIPQLHEADEKTESNEKTNVLSNENEKNINHSKESIKSCFTEIEKVEQQLNTFLESYKERIDKKDAVSPLYNLICMKCVHEYLIKKEYLVVAKRSRTRELSKLNKKKEEYFLKLLNSENGPERIGKLMKDEDITRVATNFFTDLMSRHEQSQ